MNWTDDQQQIIEARNCNLLVSAAAGSGKTAVLVERIIQMVSDKDAPIDIEDLLVVTFTKAAASQMKDKIAKALEKRLDEEPDNEHYLNQVNNIHRANIMTIDSFCFQVVKEHFHKLGLDPAVHVGERGELELLKMEVLEKVIEKYYETSEDFVAFSEAHSNDKDDLPIEECILDIYDICSSYPQPKEWISDAQKALRVESEEDFMKRPLVQQYIHEFHMGAEILRQRVLKCLEKVRVPNGPIYYESVLLEDIQIMDAMISAKTYSQIHDIIETPFLRAPNARKGYDESITEWVKGERKNCKEKAESMIAAFITPFESMLESFWQQEKMLSALLDCVNEFYDCFMEQKIQKNILEFSDVEHFALQILCDGYEEDGTPIPSTIGKEMSEEFREILIDEYQDSNFLQEAILNSVSRSYKGENNIFMVGDVKQSIYKFRMARPDLFMDKYNTYSSEKNASNRKILLKNNFRSRSNILETINYIFYQIMDEKLGGITYDKDVALDPGKKFPVTADDEVELLIGESKDFEYISLESDDSRAKKKEHLDEELEDIGKMELEATMVAERIEHLLGKNGEKPYQILCEETGELRDCNLGDMVILFRAPIRFQPVFSEVLSNRGIAVKMQNENGYFGTVEIQLILSLLKVLDNPKNDIETVSVLRGYFGHFTSDELAILSLVKRYLSETSEKKLYLFSVVEQLARYGECEQEKNALECAFSKCEISDDKVLCVCQKAKEMITFMEDLWELRSYATIPQILHAIYYGKSYYYYVKAMPAGDSRVRNLDLFFEEAKKFDAGTYHTIFDFLRYIKRLQDKSITLGGDPALESDGNVVRIMSIHKSKGLEFPIVFLAGTGNNFNMKDTRKNILIHADYFLGADYVNTKERYKSESFIRKAISDLMITEIIAEELRILYVGLTRAKEKLIITGVTKDIPKLLAQYINVPQEKDNKLSFSIIRESENYLDFIVACMMRNSVFHNAMKTVRKRLNTKGDLILSGEYDMPYEITEPEIRLRVEVYDYEKLVVSHIKSALEKQNDKEQELQEWIQMPSLMKEQLQEQIAWLYPQEKYVNQKAKRSVTEIKRIYEVDDDNVEKMSQSSLSSERNLSVTIPRFMEENRPLDAAQKGTWVHKIMELFDFAKSMSQQQIEDWLYALREDGRIPQETTSFMKAEMIATLLETPLGKRMKKSAEGGNLFKEKQFITGVPVKRILQQESRREKEKFNDDKLVVVQGIIDAYFCEDNEIVLIDYKTDSIKQGQEDILEKRYKTQMLYYKDTLEQLTGLKVKQTYIYSFALGKEIELFKTLDS